ITAAASYSFGNSFVKAAAVSRSLADGLGGSENAYGFNLSGNSALWQGGMLYASLTTGEGIGSYMVFGGADLDAAGNAIQTSGVTIGVTQEITDNVSLALSYGYRDIDTGAATDTQKLSTIHVGINYSPVKNFTLGLEYFTGERTLFNATKASADRLQASAQFNF
ncbi:MAG: hypothetical protein GY952_00690, partial [Rhodobacteraceae bacterium]|nr:hypothetical protein [Paracoccaceae bacterium]